MLLKRLRCLKCLSEINFIVDIDHDETLRDEDRCDIKYNLDLNRKSVIIFFVYYYLRKEQTIMNIDDLVEIYECPLCGGAGILEEDCGSSYYVTCLECGCHSVNIDFKSDEDRLDAAKRTADLWNCGKVISMSPGE